MGKHLHVWALVLIAGISAHRPIVKRQVPVLPDFIPVPPPPPLPPAPLIQLRPGLEEPFFPASGAVTNRVPPGLASSFIPTPPAGPPPGQSPQQMPLPPRERPAPPKPVPEKVAGTPPPASVTQQIAPPRLTQNQQVAPSFGSQGRVSNAQFTALPPQPQFSATPQQLQPQFSTPQQSQVQSPVPQQMQPQFSAPPQQGPMQFSLPPHPNTPLSQAPQQKKPSPFTTPPSQSASLQFSPPPQQIAQQTTPTAFPAQDPQGRAPTTQPPPEFSGSTEQLAIVDPDEIPNSTTDLPPPQKPSRPRAPVTQEIPAVPAPSRAQSLLESARRFFQLRPTPTTVRPPSRPPVLPPPALPPPASPPQQVMPMVQSRPPQQPINQIPLTSGGMFTVQQPQPLQPGTSVQREPPPLISPDQGQFLFPPESEARFESPSLLPPAFIRPELLSPLPPDQAQRQGFQRPALTLVTPPHLMPTTPKPSRFASFVPSLFGAPSDPPPSSQEQPKPPDSTPRPGFFAGLFSSRPTTPPPVAQQQQPVAPTSPRPLSLPNILSQAASLFNPKPVEQSVPAAPSPIQPQLVIPPQQPVKPLPKPPSPQMPQMPQMPPMKPHLQHMPASLYGTSSMISSPSSVTPSTYRPMYMNSASRGSY